MTTVKQQHTPIQYSPWHGYRLQRLYYAEDFRKCQPLYSWHYNPWTGERRHLSDFTSDPFGQLIIPPGEPVYA